MWGGFKTRPILKLARVVTKKAHFNYKRNIYGSNAVMCSTIDHHYRFRPRFRNNNATKKGSIKDSSTTKYTGEKKTDKNDKNGTGDLHNTEEGVTRRRRRKNQLIGSVGHA